MFHVEEPSVLLKFEDISLNEKKKKHFRSVFYFFTRLRPERRRTAINFCFIPTQIRKFNITSLRETTAFYFISSSFHLLFSRDQLLLFILFFDI